MIQVFFDGDLVYDSRLEGYEVLGLTVTTALNKGGAATITLPPGHPAYNSFTGYKTIVEIYKDNALLFRGRVLYPEDDFYNQRTITCEGERCFLSDGIIRPYLYQDDPAVIFRHIIELYNAQVDDFKWFTVGEVTVTDPNNYIRLESESAETFAEVIDKMQERVGGYITFTTNAEGVRCINWVDDIGTQSNQSVEFGENLLDFARTGASPDLATVLIPYGAKQEDGTRLTISSVNDGQDFIQDYDAVALRGIIAKTMTWDDVTDPANLLTKAQQALSVAKLAITGLQLSAADLSRLDKSMDGFRVGDRVRVFSRPHKVNDWFLLTERTEDLLDAAGGSITLGKDLATLTGADVAGDKKSQTDLAKVTHAVKADYQRDIAAAVVETEKAYASLIQQTSEAIMLEVSETYAKNGDVDTLISTKMEQTSDAFNFTFTELEKKVDANATDAGTRFDEIQKYIRFEDGNIILGESGSELVLQIKNDRISFLDGGGEVAYFSNNQLVVTDAHFLNSLRIGRFAWVPRENGNLSLVKVGE